MAIDIVVRRGGVKMKYGYFPMAIKRELIDKIRLDNLLKLNAVRQNVGYKCSCPCCKQSCLHDDMPISIVFVSWDVVFPLGNEKM